MTRGKLFVAIMFVLSGCIYLMYKASFHSLEISQFSPQNVGIFPEVPLIETKKMKPISTTSTTTVQHENATEKSSILKERFRKTIPLVWTREHLNLSKDVYDWWFKLVNSKPEEPYSTLKKLYEAGSQKVDPRAGLKEGEKVYKTCAVVGSSDVILGNHEGKIIDDNEAVFRFNTAPTKGYEEDVGEKITHRIFYPESTRASIDYSNSKLLVVPFKVGDLKWALSATNNGSFVLKTWARVQNHINATSKDLMIVHPAFMRYVQKDWVRDEGKKYPSTGIMGILFALHMCEDLSVHAFGANKDNLWGHYFEKVNTKPGHVQHDASKEQLIIHRLHAEHAIKYYSHNVTPWW